MLRWSALRTWRSISRTGVRSFSTTNAYHDAKTPLSRTRNIGIIAHIDAGKTTTTERMLYYSGHTRRIGDVDDGSTVTDFLPAERARGITIQSAAITFNWPPLPQQDTAKVLIQQDGPKPGQRASSVPHTINLIDTPGHADFTFEVLRSLRVLDGAVCILDGVAGVEAQTEKVWHQASSYQIPRIIYVNKLDRDGAAFAKTIREIGSKLNVWPAICGIPWWDMQKGGKFVGVADVVGLRGLRWAEGSDGRVVQSFTLAQIESEDAMLATELKKAREALVERLSEYDDEMVEKFLEAGEVHLAISEQDIVGSLRRCTLQFPQQIAPVFAGASFRNVGVQPLLDAVVDLLPAPTERPDADITVGSASSTLEALLNDQTSDQGQMKALQRSSKKSRAIMQNLQACALAFKVVNDAKRGVLVYVRVYSGSLARGTALFNTNLNVTERAPRLLRMYASDALDIPSIDAGQIGVIVGLKHARTGDTLIAYQGMNQKTGPPSPLDVLQLRPIAVPPPVFFTSIEPESLAEEKTVKETLNILLREDPSLSVSIDAENGQTHLAGMGELHLEIARDRLIHNFKACARFGKIDINYREAVEAASQAVEVNIDRDIGGKHAHALASAKVAPLSFDDPSFSDRDNTTQIALPDNNHLSIQHPALNPEALHDSDDKDLLPPHLTFPAIITALRDGVTAAVARGPAYGFPVHSTQVNLHLDPSHQIFPDTTTSALSVAAREVTQAALKSAKEVTNFGVMEPVMLVTISVSEADLGPVIHDLSSARGGSILSLDSENINDSSSNNDISMINVSKIYTPPDPYASELSASSSTEGSGVSRSRQITARVPLREMVGYLRHLRSLTGGRGTFVMEVEGFEKVVGSRLRDILKEM